MPTFKAIGRHLILLFVAVVLTVTLILWLALSLPGRNQVFPGDVVINKFSTTGTDWVEFFNRTKRDIDLSGFIISDGNNQYQFPDGTKIASQGRLLVANAEDKDKLTGTNPALLWSGTGSDGKRKGWGFSGKKREYILFLNKEGNLVIDFVHTFPLNEGEILKRSKDGGPEWVRQENDTSTPVDVTGASLPQTFQEEIQRNPGALTQKSLDVLDLFKLYADKLAALGGILAGIFAVFGRLLPRKQPSPDTAEAS